jgi:hypothetical protein
MALSETFPAEIVRPTRAARSRMPITARELVEWTYAVQRAQGVPEPSLELQGRSQTGIVVDRMIEFAQLGCKVDVSSNAAVIWGEARCDEDAIVVHEIVRAMPVARRALLIRHGLHRSAPEWNPMIMPLRCVPVPGRKGANKGIYTRQNSNRPIGTAVTYAGDWPDRVTAALARARWREGEPHLRCAEEVIEHARSVYLDWIMGLMELEEWLNGESPYYQLHRYVVRGLGTPTHPWHSGAPAVTGPLRKNSY